MRPFGLCALRTGGDGRGAERVVTPAHISPASGMSFLWMCHFFLSTSLLAILILNLYIFKFCKSRVYMWQRNAAANRFVQVYAATLAKPFTTGRTKRIDR